MYKINISAKAVNSDENVEIEMPVECSVRLVRARKNSRLRGVATINYAGLVIKNILINENRGEIEVSYPKDTFTRKNGKEGYITLVHPDNGVVGNQFNHIILNEYSQAVINNSALSVLELNKQ